MLEPHVDNKPNVFNPVYKIWFYCQRCMNRTEQTFVKDEGIFEVYECPEGHTNKVAVR